MRIERVETVFVTTDEYQKIEEIEKFFELLTDSITDDPQAYAFEDAWRSIRVAKEHLHEE